MKKRLIFSGIATALITPFKDGEIDFSALGRIIDFQITSGINALVIAGTTAEAATLTPYERYKLFEFAKKRVDGKVPIIYGTGTNDTKTTKEYTQLAKEFEADAVLIVTPYYNKGTESGVIKHYETVAETTDLPIILYNVPSRTGVNLPISSIARLCEHENIVGIKEASDLADRLTELSSLSDKISIYAGNDSQIYSVLALGGSGAVSVLSNVEPQAVLGITNSFYRKEYESSRILQLALLNKIRALFKETNPAPIKYAMSVRGFCREEVRLPLLPPEDSLKRELKELFSVK